MDLSPDLDQGPSMFYAPPAIMAPGPSCEEGDRLVAHLLRHHRQASHFSSINRLRKAARRYSERCPALNAAGRLLALARLTALVGDAHTLLPLLPIPGSDSATAPFTLIPIRFELFDDGLYIVGADVAHAALVGRRVRTIGSVSATEAIAAAEQFLPHDAPRFADEYAPELLSIRELLTEIGAASAAGPVTLSFYGGVSATVSAVPAEARFDWLFTRSAPPGSTSDATEIRGPDRRGSGKWAAARLDDEPVLYIRIDEIREPDDGAFSRFLDTALRLVADQPDARIIIDLRDCVGGDGTLNRQIIDRMQNDNRFADGRRLSVLIGRRSHSAAIMLIGSLTRLGARTFGQATGDGASHFGETGAYPIPGTDRVVLYATEYYLTGELDDRHRWITPDVPVPFLFADFRAGRDRTLDRAISDGARR